jgi:hypothetical protein
MFRFVLFLLLLPWRCVFVILSFLLARKGPNGGESEGPDYVCGRKKSNLDSEGDYRLIRLCIMNNFFLLLLFVLISIFLYSGWGERGARNEKCLDGATRARRKTLYFGGSLGWQTRWDDEEEGSSGVFNGFGRVTKDSVLGWSFRILS